MKTHFEWDESKNAENLAKHGIAFEKAQCAFADPERVIARDTEHSADEERYFCIGQITEGIVTVRFTYRRNAIRIIGAGFWRKGKKIYETQNDLHR